MDRVAFVNWLVVSLYLIDVGILSTPMAVARKGYSPKLGSLIGAGTGLVGAILGLFVFTPLLLLILDILQNIVGIFADNIHFADDLSFTVSLGSGQNLLPIKFDLEADAPSRAYAFVRTLVVGAGTYAGGMIVLNLLWRFIPPRSDISDATGLRYNTLARQVRGRILQVHYLVAIIIAMTALVALLWNIVKGSFTMTAVSNTVDPVTLTEGRELGELDEEELAQLLVANISGNRARQLVQEYVWGVSEAVAREKRSEPLIDELGKDNWPDGVAEDMTYQDLSKNPDAVAAIMMENLSTGDLETIVTAEVIQPRVVATWTLDRALFERDSIEEELKVINATRREAEPNWNDAELEFRSWLTFKFVTQRLHATAELTGMRNAILGSLMMISITILFAFPIGIGAAIYLEEYASDNWINRIIQTNIDNLAGVPSIIYGLLGLAVFARTLRPITSGEVFGLAGGNGNTVLSAALTMGLLVLPIIIINAQEAIQAVQPSIRQASFGLGATRWQTVWNHVLPYAMPGILTGTILAVSRAIGETAPLVVVGASAFILKDPSGPFSQFTALPLQIYTWTAQPRDADKAVAAAGIIILLIMLLTLNSFAILLRNRFERSLGRH